MVSPDVVTGRKIGGIRLCADLSELNKVVITEGAKLFSIIDLLKAYHQLSLHEDSRDLTAFITHDGFFIFSRVPYGLASAPTAFQKIMAKILKDLRGPNYLLLNMTKT